MIGFSVIGLRSPEQRRLTNLDSLTGHERALLAVMESGTTNADIARHFFVSEGTVESHPGGGESQDPGAQSRRSSTGDLSR
ncbi:LuxR C-terminal-related transcriptional regulator [Rhodococcoides corynebacterioides]|uniref:LuxR C-terminal-related transcriptional regulator n=1 Tax=Rhodococcoides corynebacterioides TaxID=53972 RepID=UPI001C9AC11E|nr:hypothetical protein [Rhodococcus corynebacterioides]